MVVAHSRTISDKSALAIVAAMAKVAALPPEFHPVADVVATRVAQIRPLMECVDTPDGRWLRDWLLADIKQLCFDQAAGAAGIQLILDAWPAVEAAIQCFDLPPKLTRDLGGLWSQGPDDHRLYPSEPWGA